MSPTVFREGQFRFYFNSREEDRMLEPRIEVAQNHAVLEREVTKILRILEKRHDEIEKRWREHRRR